MAELFFPQELATIVKSEDGSIYIYQYSNDDCDEQIGMVALTKHQFMEIFNRSDFLFKEDKEK
jgi:hypothetical protein